MNVNLNKDNTWIFFPCINNKMIPTVWGKHLWFSIHFIALDYPEFPETEHIEAYKQFFSNLWKVIPCYKCAVNYKRHLTELPIDGHLHSRDALFAWTVALHNIVNKELGKPEITLAEARKKYTDPDFNLKMCQTVHILHNLEKGKLPATSPMDQAKMTIIGIFLGVMIGALIMFIANRVMKKK